MTGQPEGCHVRVTTDAQLLQQRHGVFGDGVRRIGGNAHDRNPTLLRGGELHVVESGAAERNQSHSTGGHGLDAWPVDPVLSLIHISEPTRPY